MEMNMKEKILKLLKEKMDYVSGQDICNRLGVSRTAVWKNIKVLKEEGYQIDSVNNKGYKLLTEPDVIDGMRIREYLNTKWMAQNIVYQKKTDSTNIQAKRLGETDAANGTVVIAECQTCGRGRRGKTWVSTTGNCYFTVLLKPEILAEGVAAITLLSAMAVAKGIKRETNLDTKIKWPNDVIANGKKLCGILTESSTDLEYINYVVVGMGINTNQIEFPEEIRETASSICLETGEKVNRAKLLAAIFEEFEKYYEIFLETEDLTMLFKEYNQLMINRGKEVKIIKKSGELIRKAVGIDYKGRLVVEDYNGCQETVISGEVSVRGLYGYI